MDEQISKPLNLFRLACYRKARSLGSYIFQLFRLQYYQLVDEFITQENIEINKPETWQVFNKFKRPRLNPEFDQKFTEFLTKKFTQKEKSSAN